MRSLLAITILSSTLAACAVSDTTDSDTAETEADSTSAPELSVRAGDTTLTLTKDLERRGNQWVLRGKTTRNINDGNTYVFDDPYGTFNQLSPRVFEITWSHFELGPMAQGVNLFTSLNFVHSSSRPDHLTARAIIRPRLGATAGSSTLALTAELTPVIQAGKLVFRVQGRATKDVSGVTATAGVVMSADARHFTVDLSLDELQSIADLSISAKTATGATTTIHAPLGFSLKKLSMTTADVYDTYPVPSCTASTKSCLLALPDGTLDTASCGEALLVGACHGQLGVGIDAAAIAAAQATADTQLAQLATDAVGLVGADRAQELTDTTRQIIAGRLDQTGGAWLLTETARASVLATAATVPVDEAYAFPFSFVPAHVAADGPRAVATDAILAYLAKQDYLHSEFDRSYLDLTKQFRAQHVASLRAFRESSELVTFPSMPNIEYYVGDWIGAHTEVQIDKTTGLATSVLVELD